MTVYEDITSAAAGSLVRLLGKGQQLRGRNGYQTIELQNEVTVLSRPLDRFVFLPGRGNDPFAAIAETTWVLAGRNDIDWLSRYLPRAGEFSDDGATWRGAYGPRLRNWCGSDPLLKVVHQLRDEPSTRRAVLALFNPAADYVDTRDVPCTTTIQFLKRNGRIDATVTMRSNDVWWGFSGINAFEWSVLLEAVAFWTGAEVGTLTFFAGSFHLYERHQKRALAALNRYSSATCYKWDGIERCSFQSPLETFDERLGAFFDAEAAISDNPFQALPPTGDPLLDAFLSALRVKWAIEFDVCAPTLVSLLNEMPETDVAAATAEWVARKRPELVEAMCESSVRSFVVDYRAAASRQNSAPSELCSAISSIHLRKDRAYGAAWKRRGETRSILPNVARKIDRLESYSKSGTELDDESVLDTVVDLLVYVVKHLLFLRDETERSTSNAALAYRIDAIPLQDDPNAFDTALTDIITNASSNRNIPEAIGAAVSAFREIDEHDQAGRPPEERIGLVLKLAGIAADLLIAVSKEYPLQAITFVTSERRAS